MTTFDPVNHILNRKVPWDFDDVSYNSFMVNRALSQHKDCIMAANDMNLYHFIDKKMQFDYLINRVRSYKRPFIKWGKHAKEKNLQCIMQYYNVSSCKALEILRVLDKDQIKDIMVKIDIGGIKK